MKTPDECLIFAGREEWRVWLEEHHATDREAWLLHYKKRAGRQSLTYEEGVQEALCFGWIDGLLNSIDDDAYALRYTPRKPGSVWSESNKRRVARLIDEGRMTAAGLAKVAEARGNGEWDAATAREDVTAIPPDLAQALEASEARAAFDRWPASRKKLRLHWLSIAKRPETRAKRLLALVKMAMAGE